MDFYKNVTGDIDAMIAFDKILGGFGQNTVNTTRERVQINSKHEKVEREIEGASPYLCRASQYVDARVSGNSATFTQYLRKEK